jgi:hypothetical protein
MLKLSMLCVVSYVTDSEAVDWNRIKYDPQARHGLQRLLDAGAALDLPPSLGAALTAEAYSHLLLSSH